MKSRKIATAAIHVGGKPDKETGAVIPPIFQTSTYVQQAPGKHQGYEYTRSHNPTRTRLEQNLASIESAKYALVSASGVSMISLIMQSLPLGSRILCGTDMYGGTYRLLTTVFHERHDIKFVDTSDLDAFSTLFLSFKPHAIWLETPSNPMLTITDLRKVTQLAKAHRAMTFVDNTFMSPYFQNPLLLGADVVFHSITKYINGHSDVIGGAMMTNRKAFYEKIWKLQNDLGPSQSPFDSWLVLRGIKTLAVRMKTHGENALSIAKRMESHPKVLKVIYPGLPSHPHYKLAQKQMNGFGGIISFYIEGGKKAATKFFRHLQYFALAESLGGVESLIEHPGIMTHSFIPVSEREKMGITDNLIRMSVGIEDKEDLMQDIESALSKL